MLRVFNDLTKRLEPFEPISPGEVRFYVCGVTVYDLSHLGHARCYITWDVVRRYLEFSGLRVKHVQNFTDVDDKILERAKGLGEDPLALARRYEAEYFKDMDRLGVTRAHHYPRATEHIEPMIRLVKALLDSGKAYVTPGGTVYYAVRSFPRYGDLSGRHGDDLNGRSRLEEGDPEKRELVDFALWKAAKPGELAWEAPWGRGRPGWHLECSAMAIEYLGETLDIHAGGMDLIFPHHENEIAQSEAMTGKPFVHYWLHNGFVNVDAEKMSKSLGNFATVRDLLERYDPQVIRYFLLQTHYRQDCDFAAEPLEAAASALRRLQRSLAER
ncbi:MAG: cysteine--tRNA ligase, partial [Cyanobacteria bacterium REEB65]|nr:cysteine--tRNA ligase [Cyanobacteria bacterium REEB65]